MLIDHYGLTPRQYSIAFAVNAASFFGVSQLTGRLVSRFGLVNTVKWAVAGYSGFMVLLLAVNLLGVERLDVMIGLLLVANGLLGLVLPTTGVLALEKHGEIAGTASALMGTLQFVSGVVMMAVTGLFVDGTARPMVAGIAACAVLSFVFARGTLRRLS